jgi:hypothetical protein
MRFEVTRNCPEGLERFQMPTWDAKAKIGAPRQPRKISSAGLRPETAPPDPIL